MFNNVRHYVDNKSAAKVVYFFEISIIFLAFFFVFAFQWFLMCFPLVFDA